MTVIKLYDIIPLCEACVCMYMCLNVCLEVAHSIEPL